MDTLAGHERRIGKLESWRDGNGLEGAAKMILCHSHRITEIENHHIEEPQRIQDALAEAMSKRSKSKEGMIRAWGPYFAALVVVATALVDHLL